MTDKSKRRNGRHRASFSDRFARFRPAPGGARFGFIRHFVVETREWILDQVYRLGPSKDKKPRVRIPRGRPPLAQPAGFTSHGKLPPDLRRPRVNVPVERPTRPLTREELLYRNTMAFLALVIVAFLVDVLVFSGLQHVVAQQKLGNTFREQLSAATAPTSEGDSDLVLLPNGVPVAFLEIPELDVHEYIVEGTDSSSLAMGPGHRRDTVLPGQAGTSVIMGRSAAFGGVFSGIQKLQPGSTFSVVTGQGYHVYKVIGLRYAGDPGPAEPAADASRIVLETARGLPYLPSGIARIDAQMVSTSPVYPGIAAASSTKPCISESGSQTSSPIPTVSPKSSNSSSKVPAVSSSMNSSKSSTTSPTMPGKMSTATPTNKPCVTASPSGTNTPGLSPSVTPSAIPSLSSTPRPVAQGLGSSVSPASPALAEVLNAASSSTVPSPSVSVTPSQSIPTPTSTVPGVSGSTKSAASGITSAKAFAPGARYTSERTLPLEQREMATDMTTLWALVFGLQFLLLVEVGALWALRRFGPRKTWIVSVPVIALAAILVSDQLVRLLPNLT